MPSVYACVYVCVRTWRCQEKRLLGRMIDILTAGRSWHQECTTMTFTPQRACLYVCLIIHTISPADPHFTFDCWSICEPTLFQNLMGGKDLVYFGVNSERHFGVPIQLSPHYSLPHQSFQPFYWTDRMRLIQTSSNDEFRSYVKLTLPKISQFFYSALSVCLVLYILDLLWRILFPSIYIHINDIWQMMLWLQLSPDPGRLAV